MLKWSSDRDRKSVFAVRGGILWVGVSGAGLQLFPTPKPSPPKGSSFILLLFPILI